VLVGLGSSHQSAPVVDLMTAAAEDAGADAGAPALLPMVERIVVPQGSWTLTDPARAVARRVGAPDARTVLGQIGVSQQELINHALSSVERGECEVVLVVGAENRAWARAHEAEVGAEADEARPPDLVLTRPPDFVAPVELEAGIALPPVQQYALIENALASAEGLDLDTQRRDIATLWARFNAVARTNPDAAFPAPLGADDIATPGPSNRPLAFPYNKWHASQWTVDQAAALLICSTARADAAGVPPDRRLYAHAALHSSAAVTLTARRALHAWPAMAVLGRAAAEHLGTPLRELRLAELYSCFPAAVRVQQRALCLEPDATPTVTGGMTFAGGPFNHFVLTSTVALGRRLRAATPELGLVTTVSGMLSKPGLAVWGAVPPPHGRMLLADLAREGLAATAQLAVAPVPPAQATPAAVAAFTVTYGGDGGTEPVRTAIVADLPDGVRTAATCEDASTARLAVTEGLAGRTVYVKDTTFSL
jgi:acetyl-CoA C-acetyltransferase